MPTHNFKPGDVVVWGPWARLYSEPLKTADFNMNTWPDQPPFLVVDSFIVDENGQKNEVCRLANITTGEPVLSKAPQGLWYWEWLELDPYRTAVHGVRHGK